MDALLEQVTATIRAGLEKFRGKCGIDVVAEHDDTDLRVARPELGSQPDALIRLVGRHSYVREHHVRSGLVNGRAERFEIAATGDDLDLGLLFEESENPCPRDLAVLAHHYPDAHSGPPDRRSNLT